MIAVYGATGFLGRLVTSHLKQTGTDSVLIGRNIATLEQAARASGIPRTVVASLDDRAALAHALEGCRVVINCVPTAISGERLVAAALDSGVSYVDPRGEQHAIRSLFDEFDAEARRRQITIVPALGFDYAIGDCLARISARAREPLEDLVVAYFVEGEDVAGNSASAAVATRGGQEVVYRDRQWQPLRFELDRYSFVFPEPIGRRQMSRYGSGEVITVPRHTETRRVRTLIVSSALCPYPALLPIFPVLRPVVGWMRQTSLMALLRIAAPATASRPAASGSASDADVPPTDTRRFAVAVDAHAQDGTVSRAIAYGGNFHSVTAALLAHGASLLAGQSAPVGVQSPATAFNPEALLDRLRPLGVSWTVAGAPTPRTP